MPRTFEELTSAELDALYQGALFLSAGDTEAAEALLVDAVTRTFAERAREADASSIRRWLETGLVQSFVRDLPDELPSPPPATRAVAEPTTFAHLGAVELFRAAGTLPAWSRAALWLVLLRRWGYRDAADALGVDETGLGTLLGYRDELIREMLRSSGSRRRGTASR